MYKQKEFNSLQRKVKVEYYQLGSIYCPALSASIRFNSNGFHHLRYDNNRSERSKAVQFNKYRFFNSAVGVLQTATTIQEYRRIYRYVDEDNKIIEWFAFWAIISFIKKIRIKVIVRRVGGPNSQYHFWSVMPFWKLNSSKRNIGSSVLEYE